jgi:hypothetical protein
MASTQTAPTAYDATYNEVLALLDQLRAQVEEHRTSATARATETGQTLHWGHVGDMTRYREGVAELLGQRG